MHVKDIIAVLFWACVASKHSTRYFAAEAKLQVSRLSMYDHLTTPTNRDLREGVHASSRLRRNLQRVPKEHRQNALNKIAEAAAAAATDKGIDGGATRRELYPPAEWYNYDEEPTTFTFYNDPNASTIDNPANVNVDGTTQLPLPFGDGPGIMPGYPEGTREFWEAQDGATPNFMWEVVACPVVDPDAYLANPLSCYVGNSDNALWNFLEDAFMNDEIEEVIIDLIAPLAAEIIYSLLVPEQLFKPLLDAICFIIDLVETIAGAGEAVGDFFEGVGDFFSGLFRRELTAADFARCEETHFGAIDGNSDCQSCFNDRKDSSACTVADCYFCYRPFHHVNPQMKGVSLKLDIALAITDSDVPMPEPVRSFLMNLLQANYLEDRQDIMMDDIRTSLFGNGNSNENIKTIVQEQCPSDCATSQDIDYAINDLCSDRRFLQEMEPEVTKTMSLRGEYLRNAAVDQKESSNAGSPPKPSKGRAHARKLGFSDETIDQIKAKLDNIAKVPGIDEANEALYDKTKSFFSNPEVIDPIRRSLQEKMEGPDNGAADLAKRLIHGTIDKNTGQIDPNKMRELRSQLDRAKDGEIDIYSLPFGKNGAASGRRSLFSIPTPSFTTGFECDFDSCDDLDCADKVICYIKKFIECQIANILVNLFDQIKGGFELLNGANGFFASNGMDDANQEALEGPVGMAFSFIKALDPWSSGDDYPFAKIKDILIDIFQGAVATLAFGCSFGDTACYDQLPSKGKVITMSEASDGKVYMSTGCDSNFEGELEYYKPVFGIIEMLLDDTQKTILPPLNLPVSLVKFLLGASKLLVDTMSDACGYLDGFVQLAEVEATYENSRYILQETQCREVPTLLPGHGCDGIDNDCNFQRDDCEEDIYNPTIDLAKVAEMCGPDSVMFKTNEAAKECVEKYAVVSDDCQEVSTLFTIEDGSPITACDKTMTITIAADTNTCNQTASDTFTAIVNSDIETASCKYSQGPDVAPKLDILQAINACEDPFFPTVAEAEACVFRNSFAEDGAGGCRPVEVSVSSATVNGCDVDIMVTASTCDGLVTTKGPINVNVDGEAPIPYCEFGAGLFIESTGPGVLENPDLAYNSTDNCGGELKLSIETFSNEYEDFNSQEIVKQYQYTSDDKTKIGLYLASSACTTTNNGQCIVDKATPGTRVYTTKVKATDAAGLTNEATCSIFVETKSGSTEKGGGKGKRELAEVPLPSQQFIIDSYYGKYTADGDQGLPASLQAPEVPSAPILPGEETIVEAADHLSEPHA